MGAGDEMMVTGQVRVLQETDPRKVRIEYERYRFHELWNGNPRIATRTEEGDFQILRPRNGGLRPYCSAKSGERWTWKAWGPPVGEIYFTDAERAFGDYNKGAVVIEPNIKRGASPNKQWPLESWKALVGMMKAEGMKPIQLGPAGTVLVPGARLLETPSIRSAAAVLANARCLVTHEGALHHIAAGVGAPTVVIYGDYISPAVTGYPSQRNLFTGKDLGCGWRIPKPCCEEAMRKITPHRVMAEALEAMAC